MDILSGKLSAVTNIRINLSKLLCYNQIILPAFASKSRFAIY